MTNTIFLSQSNIICREIISDCLSDVINLRGAEIDIDHAERPDCGKSIPFDMMEANFRKIEECAVMFADITPVMLMRGSGLLQDPIVMLELGYAMGTLGPEGIVPFLNTAQGSIDRVPVSIPVDRILTYRIPLNQEMNPAVSMDKGEKERLTQKIAEIINPYDPDFYPRPQSQ